MPGRLSLIALVALAIQAGQTPQQPVFRSGTDVIMVDVQVSDRKWQPVTGLVAGDFEVSIDGRRRTVVSSEFVRIAGGSEIGAATLGAPASTSPATPEPRTESRTLILGVDQSSLQIVQEPAAIEAVTRLLALASPDDLIGFVAYPQPGVSVAPTRDREAIRAALRKMGGQYMSVITRYNISLSEAVDFAAQDGVTMRRVHGRECPGMDRACVLQVNLAAREIAINAEMQSTRSISGLRSVVEAVREWPGRKTLVVISAGMATSDRMGGRPDIRLEADTLGLRAAEANAVIYTLHLDVSFLTAFSARNRGGGQTVHRDGALGANGLERFTGNAGGSLITVHAGPDQAVERLLQETSAYYLLGVETAPGDRDGKTHRIQVRVKRGGTTVRSRSAVFIPRAH
jgi:VWFA-related protein